MPKECRLTTYDNPYNPFDDFTSWFLYDTEKGYNTCGYLARIMNITENSTEREVMEEKERAIDEIIKYDFLGMYEKVYENDK